MASAKPEINKDCPICFEKLEGHDVIRFPCNHLLHKDCFEQLLLHRDKDLSYIKCPICRREIDVEGDVDYVEIKNYGKQPKKTKISVDKKVLKNMFDDFLELQELTIDYDPTTDKNKEKIDCNDFIDDVSIMYKHKSDSEMKEINKMALNMCDNFKDSESSIKTGGKRNKKRNTKRKLNRTNKRNKKRNTKRKLNRTNKRNKKRNTKRKFKKT